MQKPDKMPLVSIIIPCRNEEKYIFECIDSIIQSDYELNNMEIIVVDGKSTDSTIDILQGCLKKNRNIRFLINDHQTTPFALNLGIKNAKGEFIRILGAHSKIDKSFIHDGVLLFLKDNKIGCVGGCIENIYENDLSRTIAYAMGSPFGVGNAYFRTGKKSGYVDTVAFGIYKQEVFDKIGLFDEELVRNQDDEFNYRVTKNGYKILLSKDISLKYYVRSSLGRLYKQYFQYGYWKVLVNKKHRTITTFRQMVPFLFIFSLGLFLVGSLFIAKFIYIFIAEMAIYISLDMFFSFKSDLQFKKKIHLIIVFFLLHMGYGIGYLLGLFDFILLNKKDTSKYSRINR